VLFSRGKTVGEQPFWCGTNALVRVTALREVGGVAHETVTEDIHTSLRMHRRGWRTVYHNEVLAYGLAARDSEQYQAQRLRWGTGAMQLMRLEHPLTGPGLRFSQRLAYATTLLGWFDAWRTLGYVLMPVAVLLSGATPIHAPVLVFGIAFGVTFLLQRFALAMLSRGFAPQGMATLFEFVRLQSNLRATLTYLRRGERAFRVTAKDGTDQRRRNRAPWLLWALLALSVMAATWFACTLAGLTPLTYAVRWSAYAAAGWLSLNAAMLGAAVVRIQSDRFASDRRSAVRLKIGAPVRIDGHSGHLIDVSVGGALVRCATELDIRDQPHDLLLGLDSDNDIVLVAQERSRQIIGGGGVLVSLQFLGDQEQQIGRLTLALFGGRLSPARGHSDRDRAAA
jgi:cellulose synthase (UDP-forming)